MKKTTKIITLILSALLLIGCAIGISVSAEENAPAVTVKYKNISYEGAVKVLYAVEAQNVPEGAKVQMAFFDKMPASVDETPAYVKDAHSEDIEIGGVSYKAFFSDGIAPKNMRKSIYAVPVITLGDEILAIGDPVEYSVYTYAINMLSKAPAEDQKALYAALLDYGASVQKLLLGTSDYTEADLAAAGGYANQYCGVKVDTSISGVTAEEGTVTYYYPGDEVSYTASLYKDNAQFAGYLDEDSKLVGIYGTEIDLLASEVGVYTYRANYIVPEVDKMDKASNIGASNFSKGANNDYVNVGTDAEPQNVLQVYHPAAKDAGGLTFAYYDTAAAYVFEIDINWKGTETQLDKGDWTMRLGFTSTASNKLSDDKKYLYCNYAISNAGDPLYISSAAGYTDAPSNPYATFPVDEWHRLRVEYIPLGNTAGTYYGLQRIYFDGVLSEETEITSTTDNTDCLTFNLAVRGTYCPLEWTAMFDNAVCYTVQEDYYGKGIYANDPDVNTYDGENANHSTDNATIVTEANGNKVVQYTKNPSNSLDIVFTADGIEYGDTYVFDTDMKWVGSPYDDFGRTWLGRMGFVADAAKTLGGGSDDNYVKRSYLSTTPYLGFILSDSANNTLGADAAKKDKLVPGVWYNFRVEYTVTGVNADGKYTGVEKVYINNELARTTIATCARDNRGLYCFKLSLLSSTSSVAGTKITVQFDNTFIGAFGDPGDYRYANFEDGLASSGYFAASKNPTPSTDGGTVTEYSVVDNPKNTTVANAAGKVLKATLTPGQNREVNKIDIINKDSAQATGAYEFCIDMLYDGACLPKNNTTFQQFVVCNSKGYTALFTLKHTSDGNVYITSDVDGKAPGKGGSLGTVKLLDGEWHSLRFVMYTNGTESVYACYVDGELSGIGNYYHGINACVTNRVATTYVYHRVSQFQPADTAVTTANLYFDNVGLRYVGDIPAVIPDWNKQ